MLTKLFDYHLPESLIAKYPLKQRSDSRMLVCDRASGEYVHGHTRDIASYFSKGDLLIVNNTKVIKARMFGAKESGGKVEMLLERMLSSNTFLAHIKSSRSPKPGSKVIIGQEEVEILSRQGTLFECKSKITVDELIDINGSIPIPPYFARKSESIDDERYQTVYAEQNGSVAAPTAGLHIDNIIRASLEECGIGWGTLTLHVGSGTFQPVKTEKTEDHVMHSESFKIDESLASKIVETKARGNKIIAVGTTTVRALESAFCVEKGVVIPGKKMTDLFLTPGSKFNVVDAMLTNFHLPGSSLLMLVSALMGLDEMHKAYSIAIEEKYRFYSYGDAMLIL